jgi:hypothetical protein
MKTQNLRGLSILLSTAVASSGLGCGIEARSVQSESSLEQTNAQASAGFFESNKPLAFELDVDIVKLAEKNDYLPSTLRFAGGKSFAVDAKIRGQNSREDCSFPKLSVRLQKAVATDGTPFAGHRKIKIGTHCGEGEPARYRLADQIATWRQASIYEVLNALGIPTVAARRAIVTYRNNGAAPLTRKAFIMEDSEDLGKRLGGKALSDEELLTVTSTAGFEKVAVMEQVLAHALFGDSDFSFPAFESGLNTDNVHNFEVIDLGVRAAPRYLAVSHDFDLGSWVTGKTFDLSQTDPEGLLAADADDLPTRAANSYLIDSKESIVGEKAFSAILRKAAVRFINHEAAARKAVDVALFAENDKEGRNIAKRHLDGFYRMLKSRISQAK